jgi:CRISPR/Cas system Type II protein with McrA/HNH and RuvC-like nuclease domain
VTVKTNGPLTIGLDIGIASVGWAVFAPNQIVDMGVRAFDAAEDKDGKPNNQTRRGTRVSRNRYGMRAWRLKKLVRVFRDIGMLTNSEIKHLFSANHEKNIKHIKPWRLRAEGLSRKLTNIEWAQVIYHIVKHRGFKFFSKAEDPTNTSPEAEGSASESSTEKAERDGLRQGLEYTSTLSNKYLQFTDKTLGYIVYQLAHARQDKDDIYRDSEGNELDTKDCEEFQNSYRNKDKSYKHAFRRDDLIAELNVLFNTQQQPHIGNPFTHVSRPERVEWLDKVTISSETHTVEPTFRAQVFALLELQHPPITAGQMNAMIGDCELESEARNGKGKAERRAARQSFSNERATWLQTLNNLRIRRNGKEEELSRDERAALIELPYKHAKVTFKQAREILREATGFPAHWREASFTKLSYRAQRKNDGNWINVVTSDGTSTLLGKYGDEKVRKDANKTLKKRLEDSTMPFTELRQLYGLQESARFEIKRKVEEIIVRSLENQHPVAYEAMDSKKVFVKILPAKSKKALIFKRKHMQALSKLRERKPDATLTDLRIALTEAEPLEEGWQFLIGSSDSEVIKVEEEAKTNVPIEYEDAQSAEDEVLIELKGWHALKRALEHSHPEWWTSLQTAWRDAGSQDEELKANARVMADQIDTIAEVLTKAQTDTDISKEVASLNLTEGQLDALQRNKKGFTQYRNLSLKALRNLLPYLEQQKSYSEACALAGYKAVTFERTKYLPPLETYLYERIHHGNKTGYKELRYKDLTNPVVARAFNQARLVLNALIARYNQSPAYVHVELARDIARPLKSRWSNGKKIEGRLDVQKRQLENRNKRAAVRENFANTHGIKNPTERQILKERLYHEQQCKCLYTLEKLDLGQVVYDDNYAQIDHIWPRSKTFDNSMENLVLVHAHANQDKGNRIPYDFITQKYGEEHWRTAEAHILSCKGLSEGKQKRLLARELDADEFLARNLVDTRYATRLFARMVRDRLLFEGQTADKTEDIDPSESGKNRLEKFHKTRVRTPQGGVTSFLRRRWLGDIKDRDAGDKHHALDACIVAACTPELIHRVNNWFANDERVPSRFKKNEDGTYTDRGSGEIVSKQEARERGLYLPPPWDENKQGEFRKAFFEKYDSIRVSRAIRKKRNGELHDANPMALRYYPVNLKKLTLEMLDEIHLPPDLPDKRRLLIRAIRDRLQSNNGNASDAFERGFQIHDNTGGDGTIYTIPLPFTCLPGGYIAEERKELKKAKRTEDFNDSAKKVAPLTKLSVDMLSEDALGSAFYTRNKRVVEALKARLNEFDGDAEKAFAAPFYPFGKEAHRPFIKSIRLPAPRGSGVYVRGGVANLYGNVSV